MSNTAYNLHDMAKPMKPGTIVAVVRSVWPLLVVVALAILAQLHLRPQLGDFYAKVGLDIAINISLAVSLTMVNGFTGQFSMGHAAFMIVGGYAASMIVYYGSFRLLGGATMQGGLLSSMLGTRPDGLPYLTKADGLFALAVLAGGLASAGAGYLVGLPSLRLKGDYLAIVTLGFGEIVRVLIQALTTDVVRVGADVTPEHLEAISSWKGLAEYDTITAENIAAIPMYVWPKYVGGSLGFSGLPFYTSLFWAVLAAGLTMLVAFRLKESSFGRAFLSIREDEIASEAMGVNTTNYKIRAFVISAFFAGIAGGLFAHTSGIQFNAGELGFLKSFDIIIMVVLGGLGSISGATIAAVILTILPELLRRPQDLMTIWPYGLGAALVGGLLVLVAKKTRREPNLGVGLVWMGLISLLIAGVAAIAARQKWDLGQYRMIFYALALVLMMILRPKGLMGVLEIWNGSLWKGLWQRRHA